MKPLYILVTLLFLSFTTKVISQETGTLLIGTWAFDYTASKSRMSPASIQHLDSISPARLARLESSYIGRLVTFNADGSYSQTLSNGHTANGTWVLSDDNQHVIITDPNGNQHTQQIQSISATELVLKPILESNVKMIIPTWNFVKS